MKNIKDLGITTEEGFEVKNLKRFPSMEWGEEGGLEADLYYKGDKILTLYQEGNGGCATTYMTEKGNCILGEIRNAGLTFLKRVDEDYSGQGKYAHLFANITVQNFRDDEWESLINNIEERYDMVKQVKKSFKKGFKTVVACMSKYQFDYLQYKADNITQKEVDEYFNKSKIENKYSKFIIFNQQTNLARY